MDEILRLPFFEERHRQLANDIRGWCDKQKFPGEDQDCCKASRALVKAIGSAGFLKHLVIAPFGGADSFIGVRSVSIAREILAYFSALADFAFVMQGLGAGPISFFGNDHQRKAYLPKIASGELVAAFALSEAEAGSDVASIGTTAKISDDTVVLNGSKAWISNAGVADVYTVFARTGEGVGAKGLSCFILESSDRGFRVSEQVEITSPHPVGSIELNDCKIPASRLVGKPGEGFKIAMATLDVFRTSVGAAALGMARRAFDEAVKHSANRTLFGQKLVKFQMSEERVADMATEIDSAAMLIYRAAWLKDNGAPRVTKEAAMAKLYATEVAQKIIDRAIQLFGGRGVVKGHIVERLYRDIRPLRIYEGASEIQKIIIAGQVLKEKGLA